MNNKEILDSAPEGATHVDFDGIYWAVKGHHWKWYDDNCLSWRESDNVAGVRSLADIRCIAELEKERKTLRAICEKADEITVNCTTTDSQAVDKLLDLFDKNRDFYMLETSR